LIPHLTQLAREHELTRRHIAQTRNDLAMLRRGELHHPLTRKKYRRLLRTTLDQLEVALEEIECEWCG
jgi:hypothetical protein